MPNKETFDFLKAKRFSVDKNNFTKFDTYGSPSDLNELFTVLESVKDFKGNSAKLSPFICLTNPDFKRIKSSDYNNYFYETFDVTLNRIFGPEILETWKNGLEKNLFLPEFHGREHFNIPLLLEMLKSNKEAFREAFNEGVVHVPLNSIGLLNDLAPAYYYRNEGELVYFKDALKEGIGLFKQKINKEPLAFTPPDGIFNQQLEEAFLKTPIRGLVVNRKRLEPQVDGKINKRNYLYKFGKNNNYGQVYYRRNVKFEPIQESYLFENVLSGIDAAFRWGKPAVLSSHRINYVSGLDSHHQKFTLKELERLLKKLFKYGRMLNL